MSAPTEDQIAAVKSAIYLAEYAMLNYAPNSELHLEQVKKRDALRSVLDILDANTREVERRREAEAALIRLKQKLRAAAACMREMQEHHHRLANTEGIGGRERDGGLAQAYRVSANTVIASLEEDTPADASIGMVAETEGTKP